MGKAPGTVATHVSRGMVLLRASLATAMVAGMVWTADRFTGGRPHHADPARGPGEGTAALPARWWQEGRATLTAFHESHPTAAYLLLLLLLLAAGGIVWWCRRRSAGRPSASPSSYGES